MWMIIALALYALGGVGFGCYTVDDFDPLSVSDWAWLVGASILWPLMAVWIVIVATFSAIRR